MDLSETLRHILPSHENFADLSVILDASNLHSRIVNGAIIFSGPLDFTIKGGEVEAFSTSVDLVMTAEFALKNFSVTSYISGQAEGNDMADLVHSALQQLILGPWNNMFKFGKPLSDFEERLSMAGGILADTTAEFKVDGFMQGWLYAGFLMASEVPH